MRNTMRPHQVPENGTSTCIEPPLSVGQAAPLERLLSVKETADWLKVAPSWVYQNAESGRLPSFKIGKYRRFRMTELLAWVEQQRATDQ